MRAIAVFFISCFLGIAIPGCHKEAKSTFTTVGQKIGAAKESDAHISRAHEKNGDRDKDRDKDKGVFDGLTKSTEMPRTDRDIPPTTAAVADPVVGREPTASKTPKKNDLPSGILTAGS